MKELIVNLLAKEVNLNKKELWNLVEVPPSPQLGDYAFPCFILAEKLKKNPAEIALELAKKIKPTKQISEIKASGPYLNFFINKNFLAEKTIKEILTKKEKYGKDIKENKKIIVEFSSPNTNKPLHIGHLRNISIGESISRILELQGNKVIRTTLNNDRGIHICKSMLAYQLFGNGKTPQNTRIKPDHFVGDFYVLFNKKAKKNKKLEEQAQEMLRKWEAKDPAVRKLWKKMNSWALSGFKQTYKIFGIKFDKEYYESKVYEKAKEIVKLGLKKGIFKKRRDNAVIINLKKENLGEKVILRADGTSIYITQDLYLAKLRNDEYNFDESIYVVANEQDYHFKVLFSILKKFGFKFADRLFHLSYGMVNLPEGRMKSREGKVVDADDLIEEMIKLAKKELRKRYKLNKKELNKKARKIALASIKYFLLKTNIEKDMLLNPEKAISFEGNTGSYLQYSYARASSILKKAKKKSGKFKIIDLREEEISLIKKLAEFPETVKKAREQLSPNIIANYSFELSQWFNEFYHSCQVIKSKQENFRLALVKAFRIVIKQALNLLGIEVMEEM